MIMNLSRVPRTRTLVSVLALIIVVLLIGGP